MSKSYYHYDDINELLNAPEGEHYEFKEAKNRYDFGEALKYCCALANCGGGRLVLGITDKRPSKIIGSDAFEQPERTRKGLMEKLRIRVDFQLYEHDGKRVLVFNVASRPSGVPVQADGIIWWREGDSLVPMTQDVLRSIYAETGHDFSGDVCLGATMHDLDINAINAFRDKWIEKSGNIRLRNLAAEQLLIDCEAILNNGITYAALILFGTRAALGKHLAQAEVIFEYRSSDASGPAQQREEFRVGFFAYYDHIWELINLRNDKQHYQEGLFVFDISTFNERVVREALLNAVSHRNYQLSGSVFVRQYRDRLVDMGFIEQTGRNKYVLARRLYMATGKSGVHTRIVGLDRDTNKELILKHIRNNGFKGTPLKELQQVLPSHSRSQIQVLLRELRNENRVNVEGATSAAKWFVRKEEV